MSKLDSGKIKFNDKCHGKILIYVMNNELCDFDHIGLRFD